MSILASTSRRTCSFELSACVTVISSLISSYPVEYVTSRITSPLRSLVNWVTYETFIIVAIPSNFEPGVTENFVISIFSSGAFASKSGSTVTESLHNPEISSAFEVSSIRNWFSVLRIVVETIIFLSVESIPIVNSCNWVPVSLAMSYESLISVNKLTASTLGINRSGICIDPNLNESELNGVTTVCFTNVASILVVIASVMSATNLVHPAPSISVTAARFWRISPIDPSPLTCFWKAEITLNFWFCQDLYSGSVVTTVISSLLFKATNNWEVT